MRLKGVLTAAALVAISAAPALAQTGNGAPSGSHYNLNIIGVDKGKTASMTGSNRHTIFVALNSRGGVASKIYLVPGADFQPHVGGANAERAQNARTPTRIRQKILSQPLRGHNQRTCSLIVIPQCATRGFPPLRMTTKRTLRRECITSRLRTVSPLRLDESGGIRYREAFD